MSCEWTESASDRVEVCYMRDGTVYFIIDPIYRLDCGLVWYYKLMTAEEELADYLPWLSE